MTRPHCRPLTYVNRAVAASACARVLNVTGDNRRIYMPYRCDDCGLWHTARRGPFDINNQDDRRRVELAAAGWRRLFNPDVEMWVPPGVTHSHKSARRRSLDLAWARLAHTA